MTQPPQIFDRKSLLLHRDRAARSPVTVVHEQAAFEVSERLNEVNRTFTAPVIVGPMAELWTRLCGMPNAIGIADDETLALMPAAHDLAIHALTLHHANDPVGQLIQLRRALRPDGLMIACLFGGTTLTELRAVLAEAEASLRGGLSPRVAPMGDMRDLGGLLQRAGFVLPVADTVRLTLAYRDLGALAADLRGMGESNCLMGRDRCFTRRDLFARAEDLYRTHHSDAEGRLLASFELVYLTGWAPGPNQPRPLQPGSATARLSDALGATERPLKGD